MKRVVRDSKFTQVLMKEHSTATKTGAKKIFILATISPGARHLKETLTLGFATSVKEHATIDATRVMKKRHRTQRCTGTRGTLNEVGARVRTPDHEPLSTGGPHSQGGPLEP